MSAFQSPTAIQKSQSLNLPTNIQKAKITEIAGHMKSLARKNGIIKGLIVQYKPRQKHCEDTAIRHETKLSTSPNDLHGFNYALMRWHQSAHPLLPSVFGLQSHQCRF